MSSRPFWDRPGPMDTGRRASSGANWGVSNETQEKIAKWQRAQRGDSSGMSSWEYSKYRDMKNPPGAWD